MHGFMWPCRSLKGRLFSFAPGQTLDCMKGGTGIAFRFAPHHHKRGYSTGKEDCQRTGEESSPKTRRGWRPSPFLILRLYYTLFFFFAEVFFKHFFTFFLIFFSKGM